MSVEYGYPYYVNGIKNALTFSPIEHLGSNWRNRIWEGAYAQVPTQIDKVSMGIYKLMNNPKETAKLFRNMALIKLWASSLFDFHASFVKMEQSAHRNGVLLCELGTDWPLLQYAIRAIDTQQVAAVAKRIGKSQEETRKEMARTHLFGNYTQKNIPIETIESVGSVLGITATTNYKPTMPTVNKERIVDWPHQCIALGKILTQSKEETIQQVLSNLNTSLSQQAMIDPNSDSTQTRSVRMLITQFKLVTQNKGDTKTKTWIRALKTTLDHLGTRALHAAALRAKKNQGEEISQTTYRRIIGNKKNI